MLPHRYTFLLTQIVLLMLCAGTLAYAAADWRKQWPVRGPGNQVVATAVTPDGTRAATVTEDGHISLWDLKSRKLLRSKHLPEGKPIHLAIRNQGDAIDVAYENADALIWWCDGSDKVVRPRVDARLVAFAHQKRLLAVGDEKYAGSGWDIDTGDDALGYEMDTFPITGAQLFIFPNDRAAFSHHGHLQTGHGFSLEKMNPFGQGVA